MEMLRHITEDLARMLEEKDSEMKSVLLEMTPEGLRITIFDHSQKPIFERDSDAFTSYGAWVFSTLAWEISRYQTFKIELEGHTERKPQPPPGQRGPWELTTDRANAARRKLIESGVVPRQVFKVSGYADTQPMPHTPPAAEVNRRVTVMLKLRNPDSTPDAVADASAHDAATH
jgi:chemotaxis protein MotB